MRLFVALPLDDDVRLALDAVQRQLRGQGVAARYTRPDNLHLTLAFIGETAAAAEAALALDEAARAFPDASLEWALSGFGSFRGRAGDTLWVGVADHPTLAELAHAVGRALGDHGFDLPKRRFRPHVTIARHARSTGNVWVDVQPLTTRAHRVVLYRSDLSTAGRVYAEVAAADLGPANPR
jgi:2'-5' RNA ligase